jgi:hypothetical protein
MEMTGMMALLGFSGRLPKHDPARDRQYAERQERKPVDFLDTAIWRWNNVE